MRMRMAAIVAVLVLAGCAQQPQDLSGVLVGIAPTSPTPIKAGSETLVSISGDVSLAPGFTLQVGATASGPAGALSGRGFDSPFRGNPAGSPPPPGYCRFDNLAGSLVGSIVTLAGSVTFSNDPSLLGTAVSIIADAATGDITFNFGAFTLVGSGSVNVAN